MIVGVDEVGRGAWAGPLAVGAVLLGDARIEGLTDSKKLTKKQREKLDREIRQKAHGIGIGWVSAKQIDAIGLSAALKLAAERAVAHIGAEYDEIIIDGTIALIDSPKVTLMKKADLLIPSVSAASIIAKVARDNYMRHLDQVFPGYGFEGHVGYGTAKHRSAIESRGASPVHRLSFAPLAAYRSEVSVPAHHGGASVRTSKTIGDEGEAIACDYLTARGHLILHKNWRTKLCEIDIISRLNDTYFFTEVKTRKTTAFGGGIAAVTSKKRRQMAFAAELYALKSKLKNTDLRLSVIEVTGHDVSAYLEVV